MKKNIVTFLLIIFSNLYAFGQNNDIVKAINENAFKLNDSNPTIMLRPYLQQQNHLN